MANARADCPDCKASLERIWVLDYTRYGPGPLFFGRPRKLPWWKSAKPAGELFGMMCPDCGRVLLYGELKA